MRKNDSLSPLSRRPESMTARRMENTPSHSPQYGTARRMENTLSRRPELLAPAGSADALRAAVQNGADAVYLGWGNFHARNRAKGFPTEDIPKAVDYCHLRGVRVYLTLNTLLSDRELPIALEQLRFAVRTGVDAVLVQDWGLFRLLRRMFPDFPVHASTQMSVFTPGGVRLLAADGCTRIVAARECSAADVAGMVRDGGAEIEIFVHGALCMSYSGQCAMSAILGGRSGNRGRCAQPCRMSVSAGKSGGTCPLSLKELCLANHIPSLMSMGIACLKIEGRLRRAEYVALVTAVYSRLLRENRTPTPDEWADLYAAFSRSGFTDGYWTARTGEGMFTGGTASENRRGPAWRETLPHGPDGSFAHGQEERFARARESYHYDNHRRIPVRFHGEFRQDKPCVLEASDPDGHSVKVTGPVPELARTRSLNAEELRARLGKTGGTPYECTGADVELEPGVSLSASVVNGLRRDVLRELSAARTAHVRIVEYPEPETSGPDCSAAHPCYTVSVRTAAQLQAIVDYAAGSGPDGFHPARIQIPLELYAQPDELSAPFDGRSVLSDGRSPVSDGLFPVSDGRSVLSDGLSPVSDGRSVLSDGLSPVSDRRSVLSDGLSPVADIERCVILPRVWRDRDEVGLADFLNRARDRGVTGVMAGNIGHIALLNERFPGVFHVYGDFGLNVFNAQSLEYLREKGLLSACVSFELRMAQVRDMRKALPTEAIVYGRLPLMVTENRPDVSTDTDILRDRTGTEFPLLDSYGGRTELENSRVVWLADRVHWREAGLAFARLRFTVETPEECVGICEGYVRGEASQGPFTRGLYEHGVE